MYLLHTENETNYIFCLTFCDITNTARSIKISQYHLFIKNKEEGKDQESIQSSTTPDPRDRIGK